MAKTDQPGFAQRVWPFAISVLSLGLIFGGLAAWHASRHQAAPRGEFPAIPVSVVRAEAHHLADELQAVGSLQAVREVLLAPDTAGRVTDVRFEAGQFVQAGTVLVQLYDAPEQADRAAAVAKAAFAALQLQRSQQLAPTGAEAHELLEQRKAEADQAAAAVRQLDARIDQKRIRAPFSGRLGIRRINPGQYLNAGDAIATLTQSDPMFVNFTVPQQELPKLKPGSPLQVSVDAAPGQIFRARVSSIEPRVDGETRNVTVQATLSNTGQRLESGMYATARLSLPSATDQIVLPLTAIQTSASGDSVVLVQGADAHGIGKAVATPVVTGRRLGDDILVTAGVRPGDLVISTGQNRLPPGATVKIDIAQPASAASSPASATAVTAAR